MENGAAVLSWEHRRGSVGREVARASAWPLAAGSGGESPRTRTDAPIPLLAEANSLITHLFPLKGTSGSFFVAKCPLLQKATWQYM